MFQWLQGVSEAARESFTMLGSLSFARTHKWWRTFRIAESDCQKFVLAFSVSKICVRSPHPSSIAAHTLLQLHVRSYCQVATKNLWRYCRHNKKAELCTQACPEACLVLRQDLIWKGGGASGLSRFWVGLNRLGPSGGAQIWGENFPGKSKSGQFCPQGRGSKTKARSTPWGYQYSCTSVLHPPLQKVKELTISIA